MGKLFTLVLLYNLDDLTISHALISPPPSSAPFLLFLIIDLFGLVVPREILLLLFISQVEPEMDRWLSRGKLWADWTYRGKQLGTYEFAHDLNRFELYFLKFICCKINSPCYQSVVL